MWLVSKRKGLNYIYLSFPGISKCFFPPFVCLKFCSFSIYLSAVGHPPKQSFHAWCWGLEDFPLTNLQWHESPGQGKGNNVTLWDEMTHQNQHFSVQRNKAMSHCLCGTWLEMTVQKMRAGTLCIILLCQFLNPHRRQTVTLLRSFCQASASRQAVNRTFRARSRAVSIMACRLLNFVSFQTPAMWVACILAKGHALSQMPSVIAYRPFYNVPNFHLSKKVKGTIFFKW